MNARDVAFAAFRRFEPGRASHRQTLRPDTALLKLTHQIIEADAVASDHDEVGQLKLVAEHTHINQSSRFDDLFVTANGGEAVSAAEGGDASRTLTHRVCGKRRCTGRPAGALDQAHKQVLRAADL